MLSKVLISVSDLDNGTLLLSVKTFTGRPPAIRHIHVKILRKFSNEVFKKISESRKTDAS